MVCTSQPRAAAIGLDVLAAGGHAVDAAVAVNAALGLMEPTGCGIGGDLFAMVWDAARGELHGLDGSGRAARGLSADGLRERLRGRGETAIPARHGLAVSVPGCVDAWTTLHARFGRLPLAELLAPSIAAAREGFAVTPVIARGWARSESIFAGRERFAATFLPGGRAPAAGAIFRNPGLADSYELIAREGRDGFYRGPLARAVADAVQAEGGALSVDDLAGHASRWVAPRSARYRGHDVWELPPAGQGFTVLQMLRLLDGFDLGALGARPFGDAPVGGRAGAAGLGALHPAVVHLMVEAKKLAYADRGRFYADPEFAEVPVDGLLAEPYTEARRALIDPARAATDVAPGTPDVLSTGDTVCLVVADADGNLVSWLQSNFEGCGSGVVPPGAGFGLQNRGRLFHVDVERDERRDGPDPHPNAYAPGKRPFHTLIPALVSRVCAPWLAFGLMGGDIQPQGHVQVLSHLLDGGPRDGGLDIAAAGAAPRWRHEDPATASSPLPPGCLPAGPGGVLMVEPDMPEATVAELRERGHDVRRDPEPAYFGGYQAIAVETAADGTRRYLGGSETRKDGCALGR